MGRVTRDRARDQELRRVRAGVAPELRDCFVDPDGALCRCGHVEGDHHRGRECTVCQCGGFQPCA